MVTKAALKKIVKCWLRLSIKQREIFGAPEASQLIFVQLILVALLLQNFYSYKGKRKDVFASFKVPQLKRRDVLLTLISIQAHRTEITAIEITAYEGASGAG